MGICAPIGIGIHNGQGLGIQMLIRRIWKKDIKRMVGSEWLTSIPIPNNPIAQLVEQHPFKVMVVGSIPTGITNGGCSSVG